MRATFALLVDHTTHNWMRKLAVEINAKYQTGFLPSLLPPHISLKQPFLIRDIAQIETYFDTLAKSIMPFEITLTRLGLQTVSLDKSPYGILWLEVRENSTLRDLHDRINQELSARFENTTASFDGTSYQFHATIAMGGQSAEVYQRMYEEYRNAKVGLSYTAREIAMFYYDNDSGKPGTFVTYKVLPIGS